jgi:hypothetical protein
MLISLLKNSEIVASVEPPWLETTHFQKWMYVGDSISKLQIQVAT